MEEKIKFLDSLQFGSSVAEDEKRELGRYFVNTMFWRNLVNDRHDILLGPKGCGKSALYLNLLNQSSMLREKGVILVEAENPKGDTVFSLLNKATKNSLYESPTIEALIEDDIVDFWKLYFLVTVVTKLKEQQFKGKNCKTILRLFEEANLIPPEGFSLTKIFKNVLHFIGQVATLRFFQPEAEIDPISGKITIKGKISFQDYKTIENKVGFATTDDLFERIDEDVQSMGVFIWILLDRLDVAFIDTKELERRALKSLFSVYNNFKKFNNIKIKIFLRSDIMTKLSYDGLREASHLVPKMNTIVVDEALAFNIMYKRIAANETVLEKYAFDKAQLDQNIDLQRNLMAAIFPEINKEEEPFKWIIKNIKDANDEYTPREMINFLLRCREAQMDLLVQGHLPPEKTLFSRDAMQKAIHMVSSDKFQFTLQPENPDLAEKFLAFKKAPLVISESWLRTTFPDLDIPTFTAGLARTGFLARIDEKTFQVSNIYRPYLSIA